MESQIEKLNGHNYATWAEEIKVLMMDRGVWKFVESPSLKPSSDLTDKELQQFELRKDRAYTSIYLNIEKPYRTVISDTQDAAVAWERLKARYQPTTRSYVISLLDKFFSTRYQEGEDISIFAAKLRNIVLQLKDAKHPMEDLYQAFQLIRFLPVKFSGIVQTIYRWDNTSFTFDKVLNELLIEEDRLRQCYSDLEKVEVSAYKARSDRCKSPLKGNKKPGKCFFCNKPGHYAISCPLKKRQFNSRKQESNFQKQGYNRQQGGKDKGDSLITEANFSQKDEKLDDLSWIIDSAASSHFCKNKELFLYLRPSENTTVSVAIGGTSCKVEGIGDVKFFVNIRGEEKEITLCNVLYSPKLRRNLLSGPVIDKRGGKFIGQNGKLHVYNRAGELLFYAKKENGLYFLRPRYPNKNLLEKANLTQSKDYNIDLWHKRFNHINIKYIVQTSKGDCVKGLPPLKTSEVKCEPCKLAKRKRKSFKSIPDNRTAKPLELIHIDLCGPLPTPSNGGKRYFIAFIDDYSKKVVVYPLVNKDEAFGTFVKFKNRAERFTGEKIKAIRTDNGTEFCNHLFRSLLEKEGIVHQKTNTYTPEQNGIVERFNYTIVDGIKAMLKSSGLADSFWAEAAVCYTYTWNRVLHQGQVKTPFELFSGKRPSVSHLKPFGCTAYVGVPKQHRRKLDMRAKKGIMVGYAMQTKGYRIYLPDGQVQETINVSFDESSMSSGSALDPVTSRESQYQNWYPDESSSDSEDGPSPLLESNVEVSDVKDLTPCRNIKWHREAVPRPDGTRTDIYYRIEGSRKRFRSSYDVKKYCQAKRIEFCKEMFNFSGRDNYTGPIPKPSTSGTHEINLTEVYIPSSYKNALKSPQKKFWLNAMADEVKTMKERKVWELVPKPTERKILGNTWVFSTKQDEKGNIARYKARLVAQGFRQRKGVDYEETYSPVVDFSLIRLFFSMLVCSFGWIHRQVDVKCAYLYATLTEETYMNQPQGFINEEKPEYVCLLRKAIYGLKQSGREWFYEIQNVLDGLGFTKLSWANCVFIFKKKVLLLLYVDDIVLFGPNESGVTEAIDLLRSKFDLKVLGPTKKLLGVEFMEEGKNLRIYQKRYIEKVYEKFREYKPPIVSLPIAKGVVYTKLDCPSDEATIREMDEIPYRSLIGSLAFIASRTRPDLSFAVNIFSQFQENPGPVHWHGLLKLLGYVYNTRDYQLTLSNVSNLKVNCFCDADFATNRDDRVSMGGFMLFLGKTPILWKSFKHKSVSLSTMEAEFISLTEGAKELTWIRNILLECLSLELTDKKIAAYELFCDNKAAIDFCKSQVENSRTKHIDVKLHFLRNLIVKNYLN